MPCRTLWLFLSDEASLEGRQLGTDNIIGYIISQLNCTTPLAGKVLLQRLTGIYVPKVCLAADHAFLSAGIAILSREISSNLKATDKC